MSKLEEASRVIASKVLAFCATPPFMIARIPDAPTEKLTLSDADIGELPPCILTTTLSVYIVDEANEYGAISKNLVSIDVDEMPVTGVRPKYRVHVYCKDVLFCSTPSQLVNTVDAKNVTLFHR